MLNASLNYYNCDLSEDELKQIILASKSIYIDHRKSQKRSPILVIYLSKDSINLNGLLQKRVTIITRKDKRIMIKIGHKCLIELKDIIRDLDGPELKSKKIKTIREYVNIIENINKG